VTFSARSSAERLPAPEPMDLIFHIDSNRIRLDEDLPNMRRLEAWEREGRIDIWIGEAASREVVAGRGGDLRRQQTMKLIHTEHHADTSTTFLPGTAGTIPS
jgi:hypothetical protein